MENMNEQKNNIQEKALNIDLDKQSSEHYSNQNDSTTIIQENSDKFNKNEENLTDFWNKAFANTEYKVKNNCLYKEITKKDNVITKKLCNFIPYAKNEILFDDGIDQKRFLTIGGIHRNW